MEEMLCTRGVVRDGEGRNVGSRVDDEVVEVVVEVVNESVVGSIP